MTARERCRWHDWLPAALLFVMGLLLYVPGRSRLPYHWDSAEFALAITNYNIVHSQPHAPGYFIYVMLGRLVNTWLGDPHASLVWMSIVAGSLLAPVMYALGSAMFKRRVGLIAGLLVMTSPSIWFHSEVALTYIVDSLLVTTVVFVCWRAINRGGTWGDTILIGGMLAVIGGVRQQEAIALGPVVLYTFWRFQRIRFAKLGVAAAVALGLGLAWFVPMVRLGGGWAAYWEIVHRHAVFNSTATWLGGGIDALLDNVFFAGLFVANGLMLVAVVLAAALGYRVAVIDPARKRAWDQAHACQLQLLVAWIGGMFLMATAIGFTKQPGYVLNFLPGLLLVAAVALAQLRVPALTVVVAVVCGFNVFTFLDWPREWDGLFKGLGRTARELREHDQQLRVTVAAVRANFRPGDVVVLHAQEYLSFGLKQFQLLLPEFDQYQCRLDPWMLTPAGRPMMAVHDGRLKFVPGVDWNGRQTAVLIVPPGLTPVIFEPWFAVRQAQLVDGSGGTLYRLPINQVMPMKSRVPSK